jgi:hypothetical protein
VAEKRLTAKQVANKCNYSDKVVRELLNYGTGKPRESVGNICEGVGIELEAVLSALDDDTRTSTSGSGTLYRLLQTEKRKTHLDKLSDEYDEAEHPIVREVVERIIEKFCHDIAFNRHMTPAMTHQDFAAHVSPYLKQHVSSIRALSRSNVTDWRALNPHGQVYLNAQRGKDIKRIFVLASKVEFDSFNINILPAHEALYGANNMFVCSEVTASPLIDSRISREQDFAIFDNQLVAFCSGNKVRIRVDNIINVLKIFESLMSYFEGRELHSYEYLKRNPSKVEELFSKDAHEDDPFEH